MSRNKTPERKPGGRGAIRAIASLAFLLAGVEEAGAFVQAAPSPAPETRPASDDPELPPRLEFESPDSLLPVAEPMLPDPGHQNPYAPEASSLEEFVRWQAFLRGESTSPAIEARSPAIEAALSFLERDPFRPIATTLNTVFTGPEALGDGFLWEIYWACAPRDVDARDVPVTLRLLSVHSRQGTFFTDLVVEWSHRERRFLSAYQASREEELAFGQESAPLSPHELGHKQFRILVDAARRTYVSKYKTEMDPRQQLMHLDSWSGVDYVVLPPLALGITFFKGLEQSGRFGVLEVGLALDPPVTWVGQGGQHPTCIGVALGWESFPIRLIATMGVYDGKAGLDFVGIGSDLDAVKDLIYLRELR